MSACQIHCIRFAPHTTFFSSGLRVSYCAALKLTIDLWLSAYRRRLKADLLTISQCSWTSATRSTVQAHLDISTLAVSSEKSIQLTPTSVNCSSACSGLHLAHLIQVCHVSFDPAVHSLQSRPLETACQLFRQIPSSPHPDCKSAHTPPFVAHRFSQGLFVSCTDPYAAYFYCIGQLNPERRQLTCTLGGLRVCLIDQL